MNPDAGGGICAPGKRLLQEPFFCLQGSGDVSFCGVREFFTTVCVLKSSFLTTLNELYVFGTGI